METTCISLIVLLGLCCSSQERSEEAVLRIVRLGDNITLHCDVKYEFDTFWYRECSHENQPPLKLSGLDHERNSHPRYIFVWNSLSVSYSLSINNITESDLGLYYCSTKYLKDFTGSKEHIYTDDMYHFGNMSIRLMTEGGPTCATNQETGFIPMVTLSVALLCILISACVYWLGKNTQRSLGAAAGRNLYIHAESTAAFRPQVKFDYLFSRFCLHLPVNTNDCYCLLLSVCIVADTG
ncbi:uncharacterized protein [Paramormyrops kingsleyae]|uniref:uncharacterized protein isoform X1 n=1 Tax=Paramormyrops kingsleyae TaxID=1676925 RepID=UPI003B97504D